MKPRVPKRLRQDPEWYAAWDGPDQPEGTTSWRCYLFGCQPGPPKVKQRWRSADGNQSMGTAYAIECQRCGREIRPMDRDYPMIRVL